MEGFTADHVYCIRAEARRSKEMPAALWDRIIASHRYGKGVLNNSQMEEAWHNQDSFKGWSPGQTEQLGDKGLRKRYDQEADGHSNWTLENLNNCWIRLQLNTIEKREGVWIFSECTVHTQDTKQKAIYKRPRLVRPYDDLKRPVHWLKCAAARQIKKMFPEVSNKYWDYNKAWTPFSTSVACALSLNHFGHRSIWEF